MSTTTAAGQTRRSRAGRAEPLLPWRAGRARPEEETEVLVGALRRWAALVAAGLTEEQAYQRLRTLAMNKNLKLAEVAQRLIDVEDLLG